MRSDPINLEIQQLINQLQNLNTTSNLILKKINTIRITQGDNTTSRSSAINRKSTKKESCITPVTSKGPSTKGSSYTFTTATDFVIGDKVYITNRISHARNRANPLDRASIVQSVSGDKVYITTINGFSTWRLNHNLRLLSEKEIRNIGL